MSGMSTIWPLWKIRDRDELGGEDPRLDEMVPFSGDQAGIDNLPSGQVFILTEDIS